MSKKSLYQDFPGYVRDYLFYMLTIRGRSPRTVEAYATDLRTFFRYIKAVKVLGYLEKDIDQGHDLAIDDLPVEVMQSITLSDVYTYLNYTMISRGNDTKARSRKVSSLRGFYKYITTKTNLLEESPVKDLEMPASKKALPKYLTLEESLELVSNVDTAFSARDYCMITLFLNCGMRVSELVGINVQDIRENTLKLLGKGNKERVVYLNDACLFALGEYLKVRPQPTHKEHQNALFLSRQSTRLTARRVEQIVEQCLRQAGLSGKGYSPHKLRHTAATLMYQHGEVDIRVLKEILGHANLSTTEIYTHVSDTQIEKAAQRSPLANVKLKKKAPKDSGKD
ncbi:tyrosine recombinase XerC [Oscillospiraceae bacterium MB08-C2-2]|nr:tyrosine recombinase XerC [Oscillospiraceae bacterium MB08-C2-2]